MEFLGKDNKAHFPSMENSFEEVDKELGKEKNSPIDKIASFIKSKDKELGYLLDISNKISSHFEAR